MKSPTDAPHTTQAITKKKNRSLASLREHVARNCSPILGKRVRGEGEDNTRMIKVLRQDLRLIIEHGEVACLAIDHEDDDALLEALHVIDDAMKHIQQLITLRMTGSV